MSPTIGDLLNWAAAGLVFPLMMLPLAAQIRVRPIAGTAAWLIIVAAVAGAGIAFTALAPRLGVAGIQARLPVFAACVGALAALTALAGGPQRMTAMLAAIFSFIAKTAGRIVMWLVLAMGLLQFAVVILRYVFGLNFIFMQESLTYMHGAVFLAAAGYALITEDHVRVDIVYRGLSERGKALVDFAGTYLFLFPVALVILVTASPYVGQSWAVHEGSAEQSGIRGVFLLKSLIPTFAILIAMAGFAMAARAGETLRRV